MRGGCLAFKDAQRFFLTQDQIFFVVHLDFTAGILAKEDAIARLHVQRHNFPVLIFLATADGDYFAFLRFLFGGVGNDDSTLRSLLLLNSLDQDSIMERSKIHLESPFTHKLSMQGRSG